MNVTFTLESFAQAEHDCCVVDREAWLAEEEWEYLKEHGKDLLAMLMTEEKLKLGKTSESELDRLARSSEKWRTHREGEHLARRKRAEARFRSKSYQRRFECIQSGLAYRRSEMARLGD